MSNSWNLLVMILVELSFFLNVSAKPFELNSKAEIYNSCFLLSEALLKYDKDITHYPGYRLVWADEFNGKGLPDKDYWNYEEGYSRNNELQDYKKEDLKHSWQENGKLILKAFKDPHEGVNKWNGELYHFEYSSVALRTHGKKTFKYGRIDVSAKIPVGRGVWPAIWLMPEKDVYGRWPKSGEIDVMEYVWGEGENHNLTYATVHTEDIDTYGNRINSGHGYSATLDTDFHLYSLIWTEKKIDILFDNKVIFTFEKSDDTPVKWPFNQEFYLIMNVAVGGSWGGIWGIDESIFPTCMEVDYVRYYQEIKCEN